MGLWQSPKFAAMAGDGRTPAERLLAQYSTVDGQGLSVDFTSGSMAVRDSTTAANNFIGDFRSKLTVTGTLTPNSQGVLTDASNYATLAATAFPSCVAACTVMAEFMVPVLTAVTQAIVCLDDGDTTDRVLLFINSAGTATNEMRSGGAATVSQAAGAYTAATIRRVAAAYQLDNTRLYHNGTASALDTSCAMPLSLTTLRLGRTSAVLQMDGYLRKLVIIPARLPDAQLASMSVL